MAFFCPGSHSASKSKKGGKSKKMAPSLLDKQEVHTHATPHPKIMVVQEFLARDHRELNVCRGAMVELLGGEREWVYVQTKEGQKGFIPRSHCMVLPPEAEIQQLNGDSGLTTSFDVLNENVNTNHCISPVRPSSADFHDRLPSHSTPFMFEDKRHGKRSSTSSNPSDWVEKRFSTTSKELSQTVRRSLTDGVDHHCSPGLTQNGLETRLSESDLQKLRCRPLPSLPDSSHTLKDEDAPCSPYHTIHRDTSLSPEPPLQGEVRETTPYADPFLLNSVSRQRHASVSEIRRRKCTIDATSPIYRTSSDEPNVHGRYSTGCCISNQELTSTEVHSEVSRFRKVVWGVFVAISDFRAVDENEISIVKGEKVSLLNHDDPDWHWVVRLGNSEEGFVPKNCLREHLAGQPEPEYDQVLPRTRPHPTTPHNVRSHSLPRNSSIKCFSSSVLEDRGKSSPTPRQRKGQPRHSSPAGPQEWQMDHGYGSPHAHTNRKSGDVFMPDLSYESSAGQSAHHAVGHPLHQSAKRGNPHFCTDRYRRHSTEEHLLQGVSNVALAISEDSGILTDGDGIGGTLV